jgi:rare lipoprotein A
VTNISNNESVIVKVNDRMGYKGKNHIDLSKCAFDSIGNTGSGRIKVKIEIF